MNGLPSPNDEMGAWISPFVQGNSSNKSPYFYVGLENLYATSNDGNSWG